jgi:uncharacterized cupin superfamily protein
MSKHTLVNLKRDVTDQAPNFGMPEGMESRGARKDLGLDAIGMMYLELAPGVRVPFGHRHDEGEDEVYVVISGSARIKIDDEVLDLERLDAVRVPGEAIRALEGGPDGGVVLAFGHRTEGPGTKVVPEWWTD